MRPETSNDITRIVLLVIVIGVLLVGSFWTLLPFLGALIWAVTIAVATWPLLMLVLQKTRRADGGGRGGDDALDPDWRSWSRCRWPSATVLDAAGAGAAL